MNRHKETWQEKKNRQQQWNAEHDAGGFTCMHCEKWVPIHQHMGTINRNHCPSCLWSKHVDEEKGDRRAMCLGQMEPVGLTFKNEGEGKQGELMLVHKCTKCGKISINRIAGDDDNDTIMNLFKASSQNDSLQNMLVERGIVLLMKNDAAEVEVQLFGKR